MGITTMRIGIISDTHDNIPNIEKAINWLNKEKIKTLLHCGDISTYETMEFISRKFSGKIFAVFGNMDFGKTDGWNFSNVNLFPEVAEIEIDKIKIAIVHEPKVAKKLAESKNYNFVFYGHTHKPWLARIPLKAGSVASGEEKRCILANPGNLAGIFYNPTFAVYDAKSDKLELKILEKI